MADSALFMLHFFISSLLLGIFSLLFLGFRKLTEKHLTLQGCCVSWYLYFAMLLFPFLPFSGVRLRNLKLGFQRPKLPVFSSDTLSETISDTTLKLSDYASAPENALSSLIFRILFFIWVLGILAMLIRLCFGLFHLIRLRRKARTVSEKDTCSFAGYIRDFKKKYAVPDNVSVCITGEIPSPVSCGIFRPCILLPADTESVVSPRELEYLLLHEWMHIRRKDWILNILRAAIQTLYWFHPVIRLTLPKLTEDREAACDSSVLHTIGREHRMDYGTMLLHFAGAPSKSAPWMSFSGISSPMKQMKKRILHIGTYQPDSFRQKLKNVLLLTVAGILILTSGPALCTNISAAYAPAPSREIRPLSLDSYFQGYEGSFVLYDQQAQLYSVYNEKKSRERISPDSTYKIISGLIALDSGTLSSENTVMSWNGEQWPFEAWNQDQTLDSAMSNSVNWYFRSLDRKLGLSSLKSYYQKLSYGNCDLSGGIDSFWLESSLKISALEQVMVLNRLTLHEAGFDNEHWDMIKASLLVFDDGNVRIYGKTGTGMDSSGKHSTNGWFVGFVEKDSHTYPFALNIQAHDHAGGSTAADLAMDILKEVLDL